MNRYERIRFNGRSVILRNPIERTVLGTVSLVGVEVDRSGDEIASRGYDERLRVIPKGFVTRRTEMVWDKHYGVLKAKRGGSK